MKKLILFCIILLCTLNNTQAQNAPLNKQQTLDYIEKLFKSSYRFENTQIESLSLDHKTLVIKFNDGGESRRNLSNISLSIKEDDEKEFFIKSVAENKSVLFHIQTEEDAKRLKKALEHLIEILKTEKNTDPFGE